jgi:VWFA-related protein
MDSRNKKADTGRVNGPRWGNLVLLTALLAGAAVVDLGSEEAGQAEVSSQNSAFTLKVERNEVPVRVIVRDAQGRPVRNLTKDDFRILDDGKLQVITQFSTQGAEAVPPSAGPATAAGTQTASTAKVAERFVSLYFDDLVMDLEEIARTRQAASKYLQSSIQPGDRVAIITSSGRGNLDFTNDRDKLQEALLRLQPNGFFNKAGEDCPDLSDYEAFLIDERHDQQALAIATKKVIDCRCGGDAQHCPDPAGQATAAARTRWTQAQTQVIYSLRGLEELVRRMSVLPGQRSVVFVSSGFISESQLQMISAIIDRAVRAGVVVNALDARGLYTVIPGGEASYRGSVLTNPLAGWLVQIQIAAGQVDGAVLAEMADGTGGIFFHNNNDLDAGFRAAGGLAEFSYVLVFSPSNLKRNGKYHKLSVRLEGEAGRPGFRIQARRGYFAPSAAADSSQAVKEEIASAVYSRDELNSSRLRLGERFFKSAPMEARVTIVAHLDPQWLSFHTEADRQVDEVTFVTAIFDGNGNMVQGRQRVVQMHLRDATLQRMRATGFSVASDFQIAPGTYLVRAVVRDAGGMISTANDTIEIPY